MGNLLSGNLVHNIQIFPLELQALRRSSDQIDLCVSLATRDIMLRASEVRQAFRRVLPSAKIYVIFRLIFVIRALVAQLDRAHPCGG